MKRIIFAALLASTSISTPASAQMMECTGSGAGLAIAAVDTVISVFFGGRASQSAQAVQIREAIIGNFCAASMNDNLIDLNEYERRNIANGNADGIPGINGMIRNTNPWLNRGGFLSTESAIMDVYEEVYPGVFPPLTPQDLINVNEGMASKERVAYMASVALQNRAVQEQISALMRTREHARNGRAGEGIRSELQAANAIGGEQVVAMNALTAATVGSQRAQQENRMRDEAKAAAANATSEQYMSTLTACAKCDLDRPFLRH